MLKLVYCRRRKPEMSVEDLISTFDRKFYQEVLKGYPAWRARCRPTAPRRFVW